MSSRAPELATNRAALKSGSEHSERGADGMRERASTTEDRHRRELDGCRRSFEAGNIAALISALHYCDTYDVPPPRWVIRTAVALLVLATRDEWPRRRGRNASPGARARQFLIDYVRWDIVTSIRENQKEVRQALDELRKMPDASKDGLDELELANRRLGRTWLDAYAFASEELSGTGASGSPETMKSSYQRVLRDFRDPVKSARYRIPDHRTQRDLGLDSVDPPKRV